MWERVPEMVLSHDQGAWETGAIAVTTSNVEIEEATEPEIDSETAALWRRSKQISEHKKRPMNGSVK
jgi:hypothetical protein